MDLNLIKQVAYKLHANQKDLSGVPYTKHLDAVAAGVHGDLLKAVAYLHDSIEDAGINVQQLSQLIGEFPEKQKVLDAVLLLTKTKSVDDATYYARIKQNPIARLVKISDLKHNMDLGRLKRVTFKDIQRQEKYKKHLEYLK